MELYNCENLNMLLNMLNKRRLMQNRDRKYSESAGTTRTILDKWL